MLGRCPRWLRNQRHDAELDALRYQVRWEPVNPAATRVLTGRWVVVVPPGYSTEEAVDRVVAALSGDGVHVVVVRGHLAQPGAPFDGWSFVRGVVSFLPPAAPVNVMPDVPTWYVTVGAVAV